MLGLIRIYRVSKLVAIFLIGFFLIIIAIELTFPCTFDCPYDSYYLEAVRNVGTVNLAQERYFSTKNSFAKSFEQLKSVTKIESQTANYIYKIHTIADKTAFIYGIPRWTHRKIFFGLIPGAIPWKDDLKLKSYVGAVFSEEKPILSSSETLNIICKSNTPTTTPLSNPIYRSGQIVCGSGSQKSNEPFSTSMF
jgi:hypothetical protein